ncbi:MAG TPA: hypothetical protein VKM55_12680 [Candidatus Lokiarchaeia archaeon]|nr:hypothetical protein [Candidatus Lokiarchaeia archaeon]
MSNQDKAIQEFLEDGKDWDKMPTKQLAGVNIVKMPATKSRPALLALELNPVKDGKPMKRKGLFVTSSEMLVSYSEILTNDNLLPLMKRIEAINASQMPKGKAPKVLDLEE